MAAFAEIRRLSLGHYTLPVDSRWPGQKVVCCAYLVPLRSGWLLFDTGIGPASPEVEAQFGPMHRVSLEEALAAEGLTLRDIKAVANCHLHLDHCGNNPLFPSVPIFVQRRELEALPNMDYVVPELIEFTGVALEVHDGDAEVAPGVRITPTPGHTPGHQSVLVNTDAGVTILVGQAMDFASDFARARFTTTLIAKPSERGQEPWVEWFGRIGKLDVRRALFAHDLLAWERVD